MTVQGHIRRSWVLTVASGLVMAAAAVLLGWALCRGRYGWAAPELAIIAANLALILWQAKIRRTLSR